MNRFVYTIILGERMGCLTTKKLGAAYACIISNTGKLLTENT